MTRRVQLTPRERHLLEAVRACRGVRVRLAVAEARAAAGASLGHPDGNARALELARDVVRSHESQVRIELEAALAELVK